MVCQRCVLAVENILQESAIPFLKVSLGEAELVQALNPIQHKELEERLRVIGFELIENRVKGLVEDIKHTIQRYLNLSNDELKVKLSVYITEHIPNDYSYLSDLFSSIEGTTIEQYFIHLRIEKVKELLVYDQLSLTEIAAQTGYSSVHHLSAQFKKVTGLTPSWFKKVGVSRRLASDKVHPKIL